MTDKKKPTEELSEQELDQVTGGAGATAETGSAEAKYTKDGFLSSGHTTGSNITKSGGGSSI